MSKKLRLTMKTAMTLEEEIAEFYLNCEARNFRAGTIKLDEDTWDTYKITLREKAYLRDTSIYTYGRDFKTILRFLMKDDCLP